MGQDHFFSQYRSAGRVKAVEQVHGILYCAVRIIDGVRTRQNQCGIKPEGFYIVRCITVKSRTGRTDILPGL